MAELRERAIYNLKTKNVGMRGSLCGKLFCGAVSCAAAKRYKENGIWRVSHYVHLTDDMLLGSYVWRGMLFSMKLTIGEKLATLETEYGILSDDQMREDVDSMCNLSQGILEKGEAKGKAD